MKQNEMGLTEEQSSINSSPMFLFRSVLFMFIICCCPFLCFATLEKPAMGQMRISHLVARTYYVDFHNASYVLIYDDGFASAGVDYPFRVIRADESFEDLLNKKKGEVFRILRANQSYPSNRFGVWQLIEGIGIPSDFKILTHLFTGPEVEDYQQDLERCLQLPTPYQIQMNPKSYFEDHSSFETSYLPWKDEAEKILYSPIQEGVRDQHGILLGGLFSAIPAHFILGLSWTESLLVFSTSVSVVSMITEWFLFKNFIRKNSHRIQNPRLETLLRDDFRRSLALSASIGLTAAPCIYGLNLLAQLISN